MLRLPAVYDPDPDVSSRGGKSTPWLYVSVAHVTPTLEEASSRVIKKIEKELKSFIPASVSGATQQAAKHSPPKDEKHGEGGKKGGKKRKAE